VSSYAAGTPTTALGGLSTQLTNWSSSTNPSPSFDQVSGNFVAPISGTYLVTLTASAGPQSAVTTSVSPGDRASLQLKVNGVEVASAEFPVLDVNVALVLTLRAPTSGSATISQPVQLLAGDVLTTALANDYPSIPYEIRDADLTIVQLT
jgi:hypothetical protein